MDVVFVGGGHVVIDNVGDVVDVETAGSDVGGEEDFDSILFETVEDALALALGFVAMDGAGFESSIEKFPAKFFDTVFGAAENENFVETLGY